MNRPRVIFLCASLALVGTILTGAVASRARSGENPYSSLKVFNEALHYVQTNYVDRVETDTLMSGAYQGLMAMLDSDSEYLPPGEASEPPRRGPADIGATLIRGDLSMRVLAVRPGSPAERAGVQAGWYVRLIEDRTAREMTASRAQRALSGPVGSKVKVSFVKPGDPKKIELELDREERPAQPLVASNPRPRVCHIRLWRTEGEAPAALRAALKSVPRDAVILIDLRNNPGGSYEEALRVANLFIPDGVLARLRERSRERELYEARGRERVWEGEVVVLVDRGTAGAAELIAAALKSRGRARLLGEKTAGVGAFQELLPLPNGGALRLSVAKYQDPNGKPWHGEGLAPDETIERPKDAAGEDPVLDRVLDLLAQRRRPAA
jgi:carboxyl-terminal processing protease